MRLKDDVYGLHMHLFYEREINFKDYSNKKLTL